MCLCGDLAGHKDKAGAGRSLAGDSAHRILRDAGIQDGIGDGIADLVGMSLGDRLRCKNVLFQNVTSFCMDFMLLIANKKRIRSALKPDGLVSSKSPYCSIAYSRSPVTAPAQVGTVLQELPAKVAVASQILCISTTLNKRNEQIGFCSHIQLSDEW
jgi:hypothetical protein